MNTADVPHAVAAAAGGTPAERAWAGVVEFLADDDRWRRWLAYPRCPGCATNPAPCHRCAAVTGWAMTARSVTVARRPSRPGGAEVR